MKQIILSLVVLILLSVITIPTYAHSSTNQVQQSTSPTANQLVDKFGNRIDELLTTLASKAGVAVDHFYPIFVVQQRITGIVDISISLCFLIAAFFILRYGVNQSKIYNSSDYNSKEKKKSEPGMIFGYAAGIIIGIIFLLFTLTQLTESIGKIVNPEYYAVQGLVRMVR